MSCRPLGGNAEPDATLSDIPPLPGLLPADKSLQCSDGQIGALCSGFGRCVTGCRLSGRNELSVFPMRLAGPPFDPPATEWMETPIARPGVWSKPRPANLDHQRQSTQCSHGTPLSFDACKSAELICCDRTVSRQPTRARRPHHVASLQL
jgi:hypothetical protein